MARKQIVKRSKRREDDMVSYVNHRIYDPQQIIQGALRTRQKTIRLLEEYADHADVVHKGCATSNRNANLTGASGGVFGMIAGGMTFGTDGAQAPIVIAGLTAIGTVLSLFGSAWSIKNEIDRGKRNSEIQKEIEQQLKKDDKAVKDLHRVLRKIERGDFGEPGRIFRKLYTAGCVIGAIAMVHGSAAAIDALRTALPPLGYILTNSTSTGYLSMTQYLPLIAGEGTLQGMEEVAEQCASSAVKTMPNGISKKFVRREAVKAADKAYRKVTEEVAIEATKEAATKTAKETVGEAATKAAQKAAEKATQEGMKTAAKFTGAVTTGVGILTCAWEGYNAYQNHYASQEESPIGKELRALAASMKKDLENRGGSREKFDCGGMFDVI